MFLQNLEISSNDLFVFIWENFQPETTAGQGASRCTEGQRKERGEAGGLPGHCCAEETDPGEPSSPPFQSRKFAPISDTDASRRADGAELQQGFDGTRRRFLQVDGQNSADLGSNQE